MAIDQLLYNNVLLFLHWFKQSSNASSKKPWDHFNEGNFCQDITGVSHMYVKRIWPSCSSLLHDIFPLTTSGLLWLQCVYSMWWKQWATHLNVNIYEDWAIKKLGKPFPLVFCISQTWKHVVSRKWCHKTFYFVSQLEGH